MNATTNVSALGTVSNSGSSGSFFSLWSGYTGLFLVIVVIVVVFAVYYQTIGYWFQIAWQNLYSSQAKGETVRVHVPGGPTATLTPPAPEGTEGGATGANIGKALSGVAKRLENDVETALGGGAGKEVFNVSRNAYSFADAEPLCRAFGAELATYDQVKSAYEAGADWCNYGWVKGQMAVYPTQKESYDKLQQGPESERMACGLPGMNGGYFPNADQRFGVNCYGKRPAESALDKRLQHEERSATAFDRDVNKFKAELESIAVSPWSGNQWSRT